MRKSVLWLASAVLVTLVLGGPIVAQRPPDRDRPPGPGGPGGRGGPGGGPLERAVDDLKLTSDKRDTALEAVRAHQDNLRRMSDLAGASLLLKMKEVLSADEYKPLKEATDKLRANGPGNRGRVTTDDIVERILSFDKNKTGKVTKDDLPERMQYLIEKGDTNKDGVLDKEEIKQLAAVLAKEGASLPGGPGGPGGRGGRAAAPNPVSLAAVERAVDELKLPEKSKETAAAAVKAHREEVRKLTTLVRGELELQMGEILTTEEFAKFKVALDREPGLGERPAGRDGPPPGRRGPPRP